MQIKRRSNYLERAGLKKSLKRPLKTQGYVGRGWYIYNHITNAMQQADLEQSSVRYYDGADIYIEFQHIHIKAGKGIIARSISRGVCRLYAVGVASNALLLIPHEEDIGALKLPQGEIL